ncbi:hypothetical protein NP233_g8432 [Leucocoprinus birnbaumii]|uniref:Uncharacterized protein n=1 Tax=Leucocoprinus birnbaumii TaxID=56174 RepID=A0AAD5VP08_9AGAR|nr:hypothetical protein NP233_g8432 [Leucocoprinus birnbaumii]
MKAREPRVRERGVNVSSDFVAVTLGRSNSDHEDKIGATGSDESEVIKRTPTPPGRILRSQTRGKQIVELPQPPKRKTRAKKLREPKSNTPSDPAELARKLVERLPKGRKKRMAENEEAEEVESRRTKRRRKTQVAKKAVKDEKLTKGKVEVDRGRQAIRAYFKEVDEYTLEEEKPGPRVQRGFEPENEGYITPREQSPYLAALFRYTSAVNAMDFDTVTEVFDSKLVHTTLPSSLQRPVVNYDQYFKYLDSITDMFLEFSVKILEIVEEGNKMTVQLVASGRGRSQRPYVNETVLLIHFQRVSGREERKYGPNGSQWPVDALPKMVNVKEFVDSLSSKAWFKEERQWMRDNDATVQQQNSRGEIRWKKNHWRSRQVMPASSPTMPQNVVPGQPTMFNPSPTMGPGYQYAYPPTFPAGAPLMSPSQGHRQGHGSSTRGYPLSTSLGTPAQGHSHSYSRSGQGYPGSYHPSRDNRGGS